MNAVNLYLMKHRLDVTHKSYLFGLESAQHPSEIVGDVWTLGLPTEGEEAIQSNAVKHDFIFPWFLLVVYSKMRNISDAFVLIRDFSLGTFSANHVLLHEVDLVLLLLSITLQPLLQFHFP